LRNLFKWALGEALGVIGIESTTPKISAFLQLE
jgi:hypothetical protein